MKSRTFYSAIALFAGLLVLIGVVGFWGLTSSNPRSLISEGGQEKPLAAQFVPRQSPLMVSLLARPDRLWQLRQLLTAADRRSVARQEWRSLQQSLEDWLGWNYEADIRPWLDQEVSLAITTADLDYDATNGLQAGYLAVLSCQDAVAAQEALHLLWQRRAAQGRNLIFETAAGTALISDQPLTTVAAAQLPTSSSGLALESLATAMVGDRYVLLANDSRVLRQAIATYRAPDISLAKAAPYRDAIATLPPNRIGWMTVNLPNLLTWLGSEAPEMQQSIKPAGQRANFIFVSFKAFAGGLLGDAAIAAAPGLSFASEQTVPPATRSSPQSMLAMLPASTLFATVGGQLSQQLATLNTNFGGYQVTQQAIRDIFSPLALDSDLATAELGSALQDDYALGFLPGAKPSWLLLTPTTPEKVAAVDAYAAAQGLTVSHLSYESRPVTVWTRFSLNRPDDRSALSLTTQIIGVHTSIQDYEVLATSFMGLEQVWQQSATAPMSRPDLDQLIAQLDSVNTDLTYFNWPALAPLLVKRIPWLQAVTAAGQPFSSHIGPIVISSHNGSPSLQTGAIAVKLVKNLSKSS
ncbi:MAG: DUF3352 domain-containing protein [Cyanobacteria bacterium P01_C01_bin.120]